MNMTSLIKSIAKARVLVVGDAMIDHYIMGDVSRISPEAPVPVVHVGHEVNVPGGAANVALNIVSLGARAELITCLGRDARGGLLGELCGRANIEMKRVVVSGKAPTIVKTRVVARNQQVCRIDYEAARSEYSLRQSENWRMDLEAAVAEADAVIVSDYAKGVVEQALMDHVVGLGNQYKKLVALDPKPSRRLELRGVGLMTPNRSEALELSGIGDLGHGGEYPLEAVCAAIHKRYAPGLLVVTLGADGMAVCRDGKVVKTLPTEAREVFDVSGAGDTVIAVLTAALAAGAEPLEAARLANRAAGIVVSKIGTAAVTARELLGTGE
jgi:D-beta-D-heptose 7-phosphate kinase/D-beta-D-heptose 1-phosphate adenosyltransferase